MNVQKIWAIAVRDFRTYFSSPIGYIVTAGFMFVMGYMYFNTLSYFVNQGQNMFGMQQGTPSLAEGLIRPYYGNLNVLFLFFVPFITMRLFAEERKLHTLELLMTSPITMTELVLGKFFAAFLFLVFMLVATLLHPLLLLLAGNPDIGTLATSYLGTFLMASCYLALGVLFSAMTENQIIAGALTFASGLFFWLVNWAQQMAGPVWGDVLQYLSLIAHFNNFSRGLINTSDIIFYVSFIGICLFLTHRVLDSYRWKS